MHCCRVSSGDESHSEQHVVAINTASDAWVDTAYRSAANLAFCLSGLERQKPRGERIPTCIAHQWHPNPRAIAG
jgi:hypothetical protein